MKKILVLLLSAFLIVSLLTLSGCGKKETQETPAPQQAQTEQQQPQQQPSSDNPASEQPAQPTAQTADKPAADKPADDKAAADKAKQEAPKAEAPKPAEKTPFEAYLDTLPGKLNPSNVQGISCVYQFNITEGHPGQYWVKIQDGKCTTGKGKASNPSITINVKEQLWLDIASGKTNGTTAYLTKKFSAEGNTDYLSNMKKYFTK